MSPSEYATARAALGLSHDDLAAWLGVNRASSYKWEGGVNEVPGPVRAALLERTGVAPLRRMASEALAMMDGNKMVRVRDDGPKDIAPLLAVRES